MLVKGNLQGANPKPNSKTKKLHNYPPICKYSLFKQFQSIHIKLADNQNIKTIDYKDAKKLASDYNRASEMFYFVYKDWLRIDRDKYYSFK